MASIHKRISEHTGVVSWQVKYRTPEGAARSRSFRLKGDADRYARNVETAKDSGDFVDPRSADITMGEWCDRWLAAKVNIAPSTRERYTDAIETWIKPRWDDVRISRLTHDEIQDWVSTIDRSPATVRKVAGVLSQALGYAVKARRLPRNPASGISLPRVHATEKRYLSHAQVDQLASEVGPEWSTLVYVLAYTGIRWGEAAALRVSRVDLTRRRLLVLESVTPVKGVMTLGPTKGHERREVPVPRFLCAELAGMVQGRRPDAWLFEGPRGAVLRGSTFRSTALRRAAETMGLCEPLLDAAGVQARDDLGRPLWTKHLHPHELRHTAASLAIAAGADVKVVQQMLGHKSATLTLDLYGHLFPDRLDAVSEALEAARAAETRAPAVSRVPGSFPGLTQIANRP